ncbi:hypothetical protein BDZ89DRAFT_1062163 [Hymenopellis radicata]|nr:hypothetical protein BDZ89DRAFT_1062163 [Hymenopellis radicata]
MDGAGKGKGKARDSGDRLRAGVHEALREKDPWSALGHVLKLQSTRGGKRYIGTSLTPAEAIPLPPPYRDKFPETDEEWEELREKMHMVEKVSGWVRSVEVSVEVRGKRKRDSATASPARKKRKSEYDLKDPSPLGFVAAKRVPSQTKSVPRGSPKVLVPSSSRGSSPPHEEIPDTRPSISSIPEDTFFPPSFPSHLATSTPPKMRTRARPVEIGNEPSSEGKEDETRGEMKDLRKLLIAARTPSPKKRKKQSATTLAFKPLSSANLLRASSSKLAPTQSISSIAGDDLPPDESLNFGINALASAGSAMPPTAHDDDDDDAPLYAATQLRGAYDSQFDLDAGLGDLEGFLERDVHVFGEGEEEEEPKKDLDDSVEKSPEDDEVQDEDESATFGRWFNLPRRSASTTGSGGGGPNWFGRR